jgi:hypothetical protein
VTGLAEEYEQKMVTVLKQQQFIESLENFATALKMDQSAPYSTLRGIIVQLKQLLKVHSKRDAASAQEADMPLVSNLDQIRAAIEEHAQLYQSTSEQQIVESLADKITRHKRQLENRSTSVMRHSRFFQFLSEAQSNPLCTVDSELPLTLHQYMTVLRQRAEYLTAVLKPADVQNQIVAAENQLSVLVHQKEREKVAKQLEHITQSLISTTRAIENLEAALLAAMQERYLALPCGSFENICAQGTPVG